MHWVHAEDVPSFDRTSDPSSCEVGAENESQTKSQNNLA